MAKAPPPKPGDKDEPAPKSDDEIALDDLKKKLGKTKLMKADSAKMSTLVQKAAQSLAPNRETWVTEWGGRGLGNVVFDLQALLEIGGSFGNTVRWYTRSLFEGGNAIGVPGARAAFAGSLVLVLGPGLTEEPRYVGDEAFYPTVESGLLLTETMASTNDHDEMTRIFSGLTKSAAKAYTKTLEVIVDRELSVTTYVAPDDQPRYTQVLLEQARDDLAWLSRTPSTEYYDIEVIGVFRAIDDRNDGKFVITPETVDGEPSGADISGRMVGALRNQRHSTRARVKATIRVTEPVESWLPRAPRVDRVLTAVERAPRR